MFGLRSVISVTSRQQRRFASSSSLPQQLYTNVWKKSNVLYITYVLVGCVVLEGIYGTVTTGIWDSYNKGKLYHHIDWTKFKSEDDEEEEAEEEE